jgi:hypothetical protein
MSMSSDTGGKKCELYNQICQRLRKGVFNEYVDCLIEKFAF